MLIGGTGYQYGDTDFLEYSERLYLDIARRLHEETRPPVTRRPIAVGAALALAKQDYLASLTTLQGIDQKAVLQATLYGLPMTGFDAPAAQPLSSATTRWSRTTDVPVGTPGRTYGLRTADLPVVTDNEAHTKTDSGQTPTSRGCSGPDGVAIQPGAPALPKQIKNVTVAEPGAARRRASGAATTRTSPGQLPLTGAPAIEGSTPNGNFSSAAFWPQRIATANYFGALGRERTDLAGPDARAVPLRRPGGEPGRWPEHAAQLRVGRTSSCSTRPRPTLGRRGRPGGRPTGISAVTGTMAANGVVTFSAQGRR